MALITLVSAKGSPGATTAALALLTVWPRRVLLAECDPAGGDLLAGYLAGTQESGRGVAGLARATRRGDLRGELGGQLLALDAAGQRLLLPGPTGPAQAANLDGLWDQLGQLFAALPGPVAAPDAAPGSTPGKTDPDAPSTDGGWAGVDVLADCGRLGAAHFPAPLLGHADLVVLVVRSTLPALAAAQNWLAVLRRDLPAASATADQPGGNRLRVLVVDPGRPYSTGEIAAALGVPVLGALPLDPRAAAVFSTGTAAGRRFAHSALIRAARGVAADVAALPDRASSGQRFGASAPQAAANGAGTRRIRWGGVREPTGP